MRVALFLPSLAGGGAEKVSLPLAQGFAQRGAQVDLVLARAEGPHLRSVPPGVHVVDLQARRVAMALPGLVAYLRRHRPAVLLSALSHANVAAILAKRIARVDTRVVVSERAVIKLGHQAAASWRARLTPFLLPWTYPYADGVVAVSRGLAEELVGDFGIPREKVRVIYNPVVHEGVFRGAGEPLEHPWFRPGEPPVFLAVGRLAKEKNFPALIRAFARVQREVESRLLILGEGPERPHLEGLVRELGLDDRVSLPGFFLNPYPYMARAAALVLSSLYESFSNVLIEALALGTPVVATDCPHGPAEILEGGRWGRLVAVGDEAALAEAMRDAVENPPTELEREAFRRMAAERFGVERAVQDYWELLEEVVG